MGGLEALLFNLKKQFGNEKYKKRSGRDGHDQAFKE
tara:strand:- start:50130 stop:50237 length:108 start_codon:yes stop_codon:yes gene_type:complete